MRSLTSSGFPGVNVSGGAWLQLTWTAGGSKPAMAIHLFGNSPARDCFGFVQVNLRLHRSNVAINPRQPFEPVASSLRNAAV
jgi:hypothetical protein